jgi:hypothetical protein
VLGVGEGDLGTVPLSYPKKIAQVLEKEATGTFLYFTLYTWALTCVYGLVQYVYLSIVFFSRWAQII